MLKSARSIASGNEALSNILPEQLFSWSVVAVDKIEQIRESPARFMTSGQHMVASPIVAASKGTGTI